MKTVAFCSPENQLVQDIISRAENYLASYGHLLVKEFIIAKEKTPLAIIDDIEYYKPRLLIIDPEQLSLEAIEILWQRLPRIYGVDQPCRILVSSLDGIEKVFADRLLMTTLKLPGAEPQTAAEAQLYTPAQNLNQSSQTLQASHPKKTEEAEPLKNQNTDSSSWLKKLKRPIESIKSKFNLAGQNSLSQSKMVNWIAFNSYYKSGRSKAPEIPLTASLAPIDIKDTSVSELSDMAGSRAASSGQSSSIGQQDSEKLDPLWEVSPEDLLNDILSVQNKPVKSGDEAEPASPDASISNSAPVSDSIEVSPSEIETMQFTDEVTSDQMLKTSQLEDSSNEVATSEKEASVSEVAGADIFDTVQPSTASGRPPFWSYEELRIPPQIVFDHIVLQEESDQLDSSWEELEMKIFSPFLSGLADELTQTIPEDFLRRTDGIRVKIDSGSPAVRKFIADHLNRSEQRVSNEDKYNEAPEIPLFDTIGLAPDLTLFQSFEEFRHLSFLKEEAELLEICEELPPAQGTEDEMRCRFTEFSSARGSLRNIAQQRSRLKISGQIRQQETEMLDRAKQSLNFLEALLESYISSDQKAALKSIEKTLLILAYDKATAEETIRLIELRKNFMWLNLQEFEDLESLASFQSRTYGDAKNYIAVADQASIIDFRRQLNKLSKMFYEAQQQSESSEHEAQPVHEGSEVKLIAENSAKLLAFFASGLEKALQINESSLRAAQLKLLDDERNARIKNGALPLLVASDSSDAANFLGHCTQNTFIKFGWLPGETEICTLEQGDNLSSLRVRQWLKEITDAVMRPPLKRCLLLHADAAIIELFLGTILPQSDPCLPVLPIIQGQLELKHLEMLRAFAFPAIYSEPGLFLEATATHKISKALNRFIPLF